MFTFEVPYAKEPYYCALGIDDVEGARDFSAHLDDLEIVGNLMRASILLKMRLFHSETRIVDVRVYEDELTGLPNKRAWMKFSSEISEKDIGSTFVMIDLDHFKRINDECGHNIGDKILQYFVEALKKIQVRYSGSYFARFGGEEFSGLIPGTNNDVNNFFTELRAELLKTKIISWPLTCSGGVCTYDGAMDAKMYFDAADFALYAAKGRGRNKFMRATNPGAMKNIVGKSKGEIIDLLNCV